MQDVSDKLTNGFITLATDSSATWQDLYLSAVEVAILALTNFSSDVDEITEILDETHSNMLSAIHDIYDNKQNRIQ